MVEAVILHWITPSKRIKLINMALRLEHMAFIEVLASSFCSARKLQIKSNRLQRTHAALPNSVNIGDFYVRMESPVKKRKEEIARSVKTTYGLKG